MCFNLLKLNAMWSWYDHPLKQRNFKNVQSLQNSHTNVSINFINNSSIPQTRSVVHIFFIYYIEELESSDWILRRETVNKVSLIVRNFLKQITFLTSPNSIVQV